MKLYRNYDGNKHGFGETSVSASVPNPDNLSAFAAMRASDGALTVMVVNKVATATPVAFNLAGFAGNGDAQAWQLTSSNAIARIADITYSGSTLTTTVPAQSITLLILPPSTGGTRPPVASATATPTAGVAPLAVSFDGSASTAPGGHIATYSWAFGDGATATGAKTSHSYVSAGAFTATLTVTDNLGATALTSKVITVTAPPPPPPTNACTISYKVTNDWGNGFQAAVSITNNTKKATANWTLVWSYGGNQHVYDLWNGVVSQSAKKVTVRNASWNPAIAAGATLSGIGFNATYSGSNPKPMAFTLNGQTCAVQ
jgi:PKD repeat protein